MNRRDAILVVTGIAGVLWGKPKLLSAQSRTTTNGPGLRIVFDGQEFIEVVYKGQRVAIPPQDIIDALKR